MKDLKRSNQTLASPNSTNSVETKRRLLGSNNVPKSLSKSLLLSDLSTESSLPQPVPPDLTVSNSRRVRSIVAIFLMLFSAYLGCIFFQGPLLFLSVLSPKLFRRLIDLTMASWFMFTEVLIVKLMGVHVRHFGDPFILPTQTKPRVSLLLLNHRTQLDWLFLWGLGDPVQRMKIILKESLSQVPGAGWAMQCAGFLFLRRQLATDQIRLVNIVDYLLRVKLSCQLLIFPEGTDLNTVSLARSNQFARKNNLPFVSYTMHPRCTGFVYLVSLLGKDRMTDVYDVTVAYPDNLPSPVSTICWSQVPSEVHYHVRRFSASELPWNADADGADPTAPVPDIEIRLAGWLKARWLEKELLLKTYYESPPNERKFENEILPASRTVCLNRDRKPRLTILGGLNLTFWTISLCYFVYLLATSWIACIYAILVQVAYIYLTYSTDGVSGWASRWIKGEPVVVAPKLRSIASNSSLADCNGNGAASSPLHSSTYGTSSSA